MFKAIGRSALASPGVLLAREQRYGQNDCCLNIVAFINGITRGLKEILNFGV